MTRLLLLVAVALGASVVAASACGSERWAVKTLSDPAAKQVNLQPKPTTVCALNRLPAPEVSFGTPRQNPEKQAYRLTATLVKYKLEADQDIHLVLADNGCSMIGESPFLRCTSGAQARWRMQVTRLRIETMLGAATTSWRQVNRPVTVAGVLFLDIPHGQTGIADNAVELHPLTGFRVGS